MNAFVDTLEQYDRQSVRELRAELATKRQQLDSSMRLVHRFARDLDQAKRLLRCASTPGCDAAETRALINEFLGAKQ